MTSLPSTPESRITLDDLEYESKKMLRAFEQNLPNRGEIITKLRRALQNLLGTFNGHDFSNAPGFKDAEEAQEALTLIVQSLTNRMEQGTDGAKAGFALAKTVRECKTSVGTFRKIAREIKTLAVPHGVVIRVSAEKEERSL